MVSDKQNKTVVVRVERRVRDPIYKKYVRRSKKYAAHVENGACKVGDTVWIRECRPISKTKKWEVIGAGMADAEAPQAAAAPAAS